MGLTCLESWYYLITASHLGRTLGDTWVGCQNKHGCHGCLQDFFQMLAGLAPPQLPSASLPLYPQCGETTGSQGFVFDFPCRSPLSSMVSTLCQSQTWTIYIMVFFFIQKYFSFFLHFLGLVCFLLRVGECKETFIFPQLFVFSHHSILKTVCPTSPQICCMTLLCSSCSNSSAL